jgi:hypothetical protein
MHVGATNQPFFKLNLRKYSDIIVSTLYRKTTYVLEYGLGTINIYPELNIKKGEII